MAGFLSAHGFDPGPSQRPLLSGAASGLLAAIPAMVPLAGLGAFRIEVRILGLSGGWILLAGLIAMSSAGALYARWLGRAANNSRGGWLFGMAFGFVLWAGGALWTIPLLGGGQAPAGKPAIGLFLSLLLWGGGVGLLLPYVHRPLQQRLDQPLDDQFGPAAVAQSRTRA